VIGPLEDSGLAKTGAVGVLLTGAPFEGAITGVDVGALEGATTSEPIAGIGVLGVGGTYSGTAGAVSGAGALPGELSVGAVLLVDVSAGAFGRDVIGRPLWPSHATLPTNKTNTLSIFRLMVTTPHGKFRSRKQQVLQHSKAQLL